MSFKDNLKTWEGAWSRAFESCVSFKISNPEVEEH